MSAHELGGYERFPHGTELVDGQVIVDQELGEGRMYFLEPLAPGDGRVRAFVWGNIEEMAQLEDGPLVRFHSACTYGDVFGAETCDCGPQLKAARAAIKEEGCGILFDCMDHEGRGVGLIEGGSPGIDRKAIGYARTQQSGETSFDAYDAQGVPRDYRTFESCIQFLIDRGVRTMRMMTNNPTKVGSAVERGLTVHVLPLRVGANEHNQQYLDSKRDQMGHLL